MNNITSIFLSHPKAFMRLINRLRKESLQPEVTDEEGFLEVMLSPAKEFVSLKRDLYKVYIVYEYYETDCKDIAKASAIRTLDVNPFSEKGILIIYDIFKDYKGFVLTNMILLED